MEITIDKHSSNQATIKIQLVEADYQPKVDAKLKEYAKKSNIKGFRPGKAPINLVKNLYGTSALVEEINEILSGSLNDYIKEQDFKLLGDPLPVMDEEDKIDWKKQKEFEFDYKIGFLEGIDIPIDESITAKNYKVELNKEEVNDAIQNIRKQYGSMTNPEVSQENDFLYGDLKSEDGTFEKTISLPLSDINQELVNQFIGLEKGAEVKFNPAEVFRENLADILDISDEESADMTGEYTFTLQNINRTEDAELNQEFYDKVFGPGIVKTEEELYAKTEEILLGNYEKETNVFTEEQIKTALVEKAGIDLPEEFLKEWLLRTNEGKVSEEEVNKEYPIYAKQMSWTLISNHIAKENDIQAKHEDVLESAREMIREQFGGAGMSAQLEDSLDMFVENYLQGNEGQNYMQMLTSVQNDKVLDFVREKITLTEEKIGVEEFKELLKN